MSQQPTLFSAEESAARRQATRKDSGYRPLAESLRPQKLSDIVGQPHLMEKEGALARALNSGKIPSLILWGPPGCGKTSLARLLSTANISYDFVQISAIFTGVAELRQYFDQARRLHAENRQMLLFVDEIHRFNRAQQDAFLPVIENGTLTLLGATTENPSFVLNPALLSRMQVFVLNRLSEDALSDLLKRAETSLGHKLPLMPDARTELYKLSDGDGRYLLNLVETIWHSGADQDLSKADLSLLLQKRAPLYDKNQEAHYNLISALHKSIRGSDPDAALYWLARMLIGGEDPHFLARRLVRMASEDIGLASPAAVSQSVAAWQAYERLGSPEGELALAQAVIYLATSPKSNAVYTAYKSAMAAARDSGTLAPPAHILNAPTRFMKEQGYGQGYLYDHDQKEGFSGQNYFPDALPRQNFYRPTARGAEAAIGERLKHWDNLRKAKTPQR